MFKVTLSVYLWDSHSELEASRWVNFYKELELPFAPFPGLELSFPLERPVRLRRVSWDTEGRSFRCTGEDFCLDAASLEAPDFDEWIEEAESNGWRVEGPHAKQR